MKEALIDTLKVCLKATLVGILFAYSVGYGYELGEYPEFVYHCTMSDIEWFELFMHQFKVGWYMYMLFTVVKISCELLLKLIRKKCQNRYYDNNSGGITQSCSRIV